MNINVITTFGYSVIRLSTPLIFAALSAAICEKAGLFNMAVESMMLWGAIMGVIVSGYTQSAFLGFLAAIVVGIVVGEVISFATVKGKADLMLAQIAVNLASVGGTIFLLFALTGEKSNSAVAINSLAMPTVNIPLIKSIPIIGPIVSGHNILTYLAFLVTYLMYLLMKKTKIGAHICAVGENPNAADSVGISTTKLYYLSWGIAGLLGGMGGAFMSMGYLTSFTKNMVSGRGYIGLCASSMVGGSPVGSMLCAMLFGVADAASNSLQLTNAPTDIVLMLPYVATIVGMIAISAAKANKMKKKISEKLNETAKA